MCICIVCPTHGNKQSIQIKNLANESKTSEIGDVIMEDQLKEPKIDPHQMAIDKLTYALNMVKIKANQEPNLDTKAKFEKYASLLKQQLSDVITA
uniref:Uncharacterized protein n=1 Tax=Romanomermis culicivorax TaxID=13658 RepID=A0A915JPF4_ROMCU